MNVYDTLDILQWANDTIRAEVYDITKNGKDYYCKHKEYRDNLVVEMFINATISILEESRGTQ